MKKIILFLGLIFIIFIILVGVSFYKKYQKKSQFQCENCNVLIVGFDAEQFKHLSYAGYSKETSPV